MTPNIDKIIQSLQKSTQQIDNLNEQMNDLSNSSQDLHKTVKLNKEVCFFFKQNYLKILSILFSPSSIMMNLII